MIDQAILQAAMPPADIAPEDPPQDPTGLDARDRAYWNGFVKYVQQKGLKGSPQLDRRDLSLSKKLFAEYNVLNKGDYDYDRFVPMVQQHIADYRKKAIENILAGKSGIKDYNGDPAKYDFDGRFMTGLSSVDGWAGSKTTSWSFPNEKVPVTDQHGKKVREERNTVFDNISRVPMLSTNKLRK